MLVAANSRFDSIGEHQDGFPHDGAGTHRMVLCVGTTEVCKPSGTHGWTKLISQVINGLGNQCPLLLPHVIRNSKFHANLQIIDIMSIIDLIYIMRIIDIIDIMRLIDIIDTSLYLFGLGLGFESHIPENVVDDMNDVLVQHVHFLRDRSFDRVAEKKGNWSCTCQWKMEGILLTYRLGRQAVDQGSFRRWGAISASQST